MEGRPAVRRQPDELGVDSHALHKQIRPARALAPVRQKGPAHAAVEHDEALVPVPQRDAARAPAHLRSLRGAAEDFAVGANVEASIIANNDTDVGCLVGDLEDGEGLVVDAVHDEDEVGGGVEPVVEKEAQVVAGVGGVREGIEDQCAPGVVGGRREGAIDEAAGGVELAFGYVGVWYLGRGC